MMRFAGKNVLVTGAAVGIGRACAVRFAKEGANVLLMDMNEVKLAQVVQELSGCPGKVLPKVCDVSDEAAVKQAVADAEGKIGSIDILVNNAALWRHRAAFWEVPAEDWHTYLNINVLGCVFCAQAVLPHMLEKHWGRIINVASVAGVYGNANMTMYSATKGAVIAMTKALAKEVTAKGVLVNSVSPGSVSNSAEADMDYTSQSELSFMGRTGSDNENASLICFLASDEASYISGENIMIDGCRKKM